MKNTWRNGTFASKGFKALQHFPVKIDCLIGNLLKSGENLEGTKEHRARQSLYGKKTGWQILCAGTKVISPWAWHGWNDICARRGFCRMAFWGYPSWRGGSCEKKMPDTHLSLQTAVSGNILFFSDTYDMASVRIQAIDGNGNCASYCQAWILPLQKEECAVHMQRQTEQREACHTV